MTGNPLPGIPARHSGPCPGCGTHIQAGETRVARHRGAEICVECVMAGRMPQEVAE